jgi:hypothetical protein
MKNPLRNHLAQYLSAEVTGPIAELATAIHAKHENSVAILAYGSALRELDPSSTLIDYYVLTEDEDGVSSNWLSRKLCKLVPPNVYYIEASVQEKTCRAKYAVLPMASLQARVGHVHANPYFWVRFAQPMKCIWVKDDAAFEAVLNIVQCATETAANTARSLAPNGSAANQWTRLFQETYRTELRPEASTRAATIVASQANELEQRLTLAGNKQTSARSWSLRRMQGKALSVLRLLKAAFTFQGGADYAAWKISRHSGVNIKITDWHRRHPLLASIVLLPHLLRRGALK